MTGLDIFAAFLELYPEFGSNVDSFSPNAVDDTIQIYLKNTKDHFEFTYNNSEDYTLTLHAANPPKNYGILSDIGVILAMMTFTILMFWSACQLSVYAASVDQFIFPEATESSETIAETEAVPETTAPEPSVEETIVTEPPTELVTEPETSQPVPPVNERDVELLACAIYTEVGGHCEDCLRYCGDVILNRVASGKFPNTIEGVLTAPGQYAAFGNGVKWPSRANSSYEQKYVERAYRVARELLEGKHSWIYGQGYVWQARFVQGKEGFYCCGEYYGRS